MDLRRLGIFLLVACGGPTPSSIVQTQPYEVKWYEGPKDTALAILLPDPFLPEAHWKPVIKVLRKNRLAVAVVSWKTGVDRGQFFRELELQGFENTLSDAVSTNSQLNARVILAQSEWTLLGRQMAASYTNCTLFLVDGFFLAPSLEWNALGQGDTIQGQKLRRQMDLSAWAAQARRIPYSQSRDSLFEGRSYAYWWAFENAGYSPASPLNSGAWIFSKNHPWLSASSVRLIQSLGPTYFSAYANSDQPFYTEMAQQIDAQLFQH